MQGGTGWLLTNRSGTYLNVTRFEVGSSKVPFWVHTAVLAHRSGRFADAYRDVGHAAPGRPHIVSLPETEPSTFRLFIAWLYTKNIIPLPPDLRVTDAAVDSRRLVDTRDADAPDDPVCDTQLIQLYAFASDFGVPELANQAITTLVLRNEYACRTTEAEAIRVVFEVDQSKPARKVQELLVQEAVRRVRPDLTGDLTVFHPAYANQVFHSVIVRMTCGYSRPISLNKYCGVICEAHTHRSSNEKESCIKELPDSSVDPQYASNQQ